MRNALIPLLKSYTHDVLVQTRDALGISQEKMAHLLEMSTRGYAELESGHSCCSLMTLIIFIFSCCPDRRAFWEDLFNVLEKALETENGEA